LRAFAFSSGPHYTFAPCRPAAFEAWLRRYWEVGNSCPEWCFVAEHDGHYVASIGYEGDLSELREPPPGDHCDKGARP
jgi:hypothetical protein